jgi:hypothetical protein
MEVRVAALGAEMDFLLPMHSALVGVAQICCSDFHFPNHFVPLQHSSCLYFLLEQACSLAAWFSTLAKNFFQPNTLPDTSCSSSRRKSSSFVGFM